MNDSSSVIDLFLKIQQDLHGEVSYFINWGRFFAAFGAVYMIFLVYRKITQSQTFSWDPIVRILFVLIFLGFYNPIIEFIDDWFTEMGKVVQLQSEDLSKIEWQDNITSYLNEKKGLLDSNIKNLENSISDLPADQQEILNDTNKKILSSTNKADISTIEKTVNVISSSAKLIWNTLTSITDLYAYLLNEFFDVILVSLLQNICSFLLYCLMGLRVFFISILYLLGPFAIGFSLYPRFQNTLISWLGRYIKVCFWLPIAYLLEGILSLTTIELFESFANTKNSLVYIDAFFMKIVIFTTISVVAIICYSLVPRLAGWIINASGIASAASQMRQNMNTANSMTKAPRRKAKTEVKKILNKLKQK